MPKHRLAILTTHPIQYQVPWFQRLAKVPEVDLTVYYCFIPDASHQDVEFGMAIQWDIPLLEGYHYQVLKNIAAQPGTASFRGCDTPEIVQRIRQGKFDAVLVNGWVVKSCLQALWACRRYNVPCMVRGDSNALPPRPWWKRTLHRILVRQYAALLYVGLSNARFYRGYGISEERLFSAPHCVDNGRFGRGADSFRSQRDALRSKWGIPGDRTTFLFCAKVIDRKRPMDVLQAVSQAAGRGTPLHLLMVGDGARRPECERFARENCLPVTFAGFLNQSELPRAYAAADCLVLASDYSETWGLVVNEGMASGLPAVVSDRVGCAADLIVEGQTGQVFPFGDVDALASRLVQLALNPAHLQQMGQAARRHVAGYSFEAVVDGVLEALRWLEAGRWKLGDGRHKSSRDNPEFSNFQLPSPNSQQ